MQRQCIAENVKRRVEWKHPLNEMRWVDTCWVIVMIATGWDKKWGRESTTVDCLYKVFHWCLTVNVNLTATQFYIGLEVASVVHCQIQRRAGRQHCSLVSTSTPVSTNWFSSIVGDHIRDFGPLLQEDRPNSECSSQTVVNRITLEDRGIPSWQTAVCPLCLCLLQLISQVYLEVQSKFVNPGSLYKRCHILRNTLCYFLHYQGMLHYSFHGTEIEKLKLTFPVRFYPCLLVERPNLPCCSSIDTPGVYPQKDVYAISRSSSIP